MRNFAKDFWGIGITLDSMGATFKKLNIVGGWLVFLISFIVYFFTLEPSVSIWDCGEYISTAFKLQVGHPPGAPLFQLLGRLLSLFALGHAEKVVLSINILSALASASTVMFLFWTITLLARRLFLKSIELDTALQPWLVLAMGFVGSMAFSFTDSFWFSAVEGEVYALSSLFTAIVFWAALRWEADENDFKNDRWLLLIAYLIGLSIGVHLLNLLTIPAIVLIYYFRKWHPTPWGTIAALILGFAVVALLLYGFIPMTVQLFAFSELLTVNTLHLSFNSGSIVFAFLILGLISTGLIYANRPKAIYRVLFLSFAFAIGILVMGESLFFREWSSLIIRSGMILILGFFLFLLLRKPGLLQSVLLSLTFLLIGYSSFLIIIIRANANPPINENSPTDALGLLAYLNREQYGDWPLLYGPNYNSERIGYKDGRPIYMKDRLANRYIVKNSHRGWVEIYDPRQMVFFPRMYSTRPEHIEEYQYWSGLIGAPKDYQPRFSDRLRFFFNYQVSHMYWRYFMWNFAGRQNDSQGLANKADGNWLTGIPFIDSQLVGDQWNLPEHLQSKAYNRYYLLPLLLGLLGLFYHYRLDPEGWLVVALVFFMTGIAIVIFLNQYSPQPRERDYSYVASFYAFTIWIGIGVGQIFKWLKRILRPQIALPLAFLSSLIVPALLLAENFDDHDRSGRYTVRQMAKSYLDSCAPNAILFTHGDNDTFPLWYMQEVEGYRTDVRVCNLSLLGLDWYIEQMKRKVYNSDPLPVSLGFNFIKSGSYEAILLPEADTLEPQPYSLEDLFEGMAFNPSAYLLDSLDESLALFPSGIFSMSVDKNAVRVSDLENWIEPGEITDQMVFEIPGRYLDKAGLVVIDIILHNQWKRPIYFGPEATNEAFYGFDRYFRTDGILYRLCPLKPDTLQGGQLVLNAERNYSLFMDKIALMMNDPSHFYSQDLRRSYFPHRSAIVATARQLVNHKQYAYAIEVCKRSLEDISPNVVPYDYYSVQMAGLLLKAGDTTTSLNLGNEITRQCKESLDYYFSLPQIFTFRYEQDIHINLGLLTLLAKIYSDDFFLSRLEENPDETFNHFLQLYYNHFYKDTSP